MVCGHNTGAGEPVNATLWLLVPAPAAWAHAALLKTSPQASVTVNGSPAQVTLNRAQYFRIIIDRE